MTDKESKSGYAVVLVGEIGSSVLYVLDDETNAIEVAEALHKALRETAGDAVKVLIQETTLMLQNPNKSSVLTSPSIYISPPSITTTRGGVLWTSDNINGTL